MPRKPKTEHKAPKTEHKAPKTEPESEKHEKPEESPPTEPEPEPRLEPEPLNLTARLRCGACGAEVEIHDQGAVPVRCPICGGSYRIQLPTLSLTASE